MMCLKYFYKLNYIFKKNVHVVNKWEVAKLNLFLKIKWSGLKHLKNCQSYN